MQVLLTVPFLPEQIQQLEDLGYEILFENEKTSDFSGNYSDVEVLMTYNGCVKIDRARLPKLRWVQLTSIGFDQVPAAYQGHDIIITNNQGGYSPQIGEWVVGMMLAIEKRFHDIRRNQQEKTWQLNMDIDGLAGKTALFVGTGSLAKESVKRLQGFDMTIIGLNRTGHPEAGFDETYPLADAPGILPRADHVICCLPATSATTGLINRDFIFAMKRGAHLHNVSRGAIIVESDLLEHHKHLGIVALDVFQEEPLPVDSPLWTLDNILISSHNSWVNQQIRAQRFALFRDNLTRFKQGADLKNRVQLARGY